MSEEEKIRQAIGSLIQRLGQYDWLLISASNTVLAYRCDNDEFFAMGEDKVIRFLAEKECGSER